MLNSSSYHLMNNFTAVKINEAVGRKNLKGLKDKVCGLYQITMICIPSSEIYNVYKH